MDEVDADSLLSVEVATASDGTVSVRLAGELDLSNVERLAAEVAPKLVERPRQLIVDARELEFADSSGIALWLRWSGEVDRFQLRDPSPLLRRVLVAMGLDGRLELA